MEIKDLKPKQGDVNLVVEVIDKGEERTFQKFGRSGRVANATVKDDSGEIKLTLWNENIDAVNVGDKLQLTGCYINEFQGEMQLTTGKAGKIEVAGKAAEKPKEKPDSEEDVEPEEATEEEDLETEE